LPLHLLGRLRQLSSSSRIVDPAKQRLSQRAPPRLSQRPPHVLLAPKFAAAFSAQAASRLSFSSAS
jgi:hypothetical protein